MKKLKKKRKPADRDNRQHLGLAGTSGFSGTSPLWSQTPNMAPPLGPGPSYVQLQRPLTDNRQHLGFVGNSGSSGTGPFWNQTPNMAPPSVPGPSYAQLQRTVTRNGVFCRWCERCKSGISYYEDSYICLECKYWLCYGCRTVHTTLHPQRVKIKMRQWIEFSEEHEPISTCSQCSTVRLARLQCTSNNCGHSLCLACFHVYIYLDKFLEDHIKKEPTHQEFLAIYPDEWSVTETWKKSPCECSKEEPVRRHPAWAIHCEKCHDLIEIGSSIYWCSYCRQRWGFGQWICEPCFETDEDNMQHKQKHYFTKALIIEDPNLPDTHKEQYYCPICRQWLKGTEYAYHKHDIGSYSGAMSIQRNPDLWWVLSPGLKDASRLHRYQSCDKELVAINSYQYPDEIGGNVMSKCVMCQFLLAYNRPATLCVKGNCNQHIYCASCTEDKRIDHRHKDSMYVVKVIRKTNLPVSPHSPVQCWKCTKTWRKTSFNGLFCNHCKYFAICWGCIGAAANGPSFELISGLPHQTTAGSSNTCTAADWLLIYEWPASPDYSGQRQYLYGVQTGF